ncbi:MAG: hypothetical protein NZL90_04765 [Aquificaceae bacterium]|nr:hypothetical protein [Aquificaceae bacterium]MDW8237727.1 hypothetical protein [Aquificaceae bacterium]
MTNLLSRFLCSGPFSFAVGFGMGVLALYLLDKSRERGKIQKTQQEIEEMVKALEAKKQ